MLRIGAVASAATLGGLFFTPLDAQPGALDYVQGFRMAVRALTTVLLVCAALSAALGSMHHAVRIGA